MTTIAHLLDDDRLGGVTGVIQQQHKSLTRWDHRTVVLPTVGRLAPRIDADLAIVHFTVGWPKLPFLASLRARRLRRRVILVEHSYTEGFERHCVPEPGRFRAMLRLAYALVDHVVAVSHGQARWMLEHRLVDEAKLSVITQGRDLPQLFNLPLPAARRQPLRLLAYGRFHRQKGFDRAIAAMRLLPPGLARLTLVGYGEDEAALRAAAAGLENVEFFGRFTDPTALLAAADAVLMPSRWEAFGQVAAEARAAGRPLIAAAVDGIPEQLPAEAGILVPADDPEALAAAIGSLAHRDLAAMGAAGRRSVEGLFERHCVAWEALLERISGRRVPRPAPIAAAGEPA
ncbi:MAG: glycosyltransferase family 4 protein [Dongiaceae bacterium]